MPKIKPLDSFLLWKLRPAAASDLIKRMLAWKRQICSTPNGVFWVDTASNFGFSIAYCEGNYEPHMLHVIKSLLGPGDTFVDLGANEGFFSVAASKLVEGVGRVIAIEPQQRLQNVILTNLHLNNCLNVDVECLAVGRQDSFASFFLAPSTNTGPSGLLRATKYRVPKEVARVIKLKNPFRNLAVNSAKLIKIDIEGGEHDAIFGSSDLFQSHAIDYIALELHPSQLAKQGLDGSEITRFLIGCGYTVCTQFTGLVLKPPRAETQTRCLANAT